MRRETRKRLRSAVPSYRNNNMTEMSQSLNFKSSGKDDGYLSVERPLVKFNSSKNS